MSTLARIDLAALRRYAEDAISEGERPKVTGGEVLALIDALRAVQRIEAGLHPLDPIGPRLAQVVERFE